MKAGTKPETRDKVLATAGTLKLYGDRWSYWITREISSESGKCYEKRIAGYRNNLSLLAEDMLKSRLSDSDAKTMKQVLKEFDKARKDYLELIKDFLKKRGLK